MSDLNNAEIRWLDSGQPYSEKFADIYHSKHGGIEESEYVFLQANALKLRWQKTQARKSVFTLAELGFGTGLNFLLCWRLWQQLNPSRQRLHYIAFENFPLTQMDMGKALEQWPELEEFSSTLLRLYPDHTAGLHRLVFSEQLILDIHYGDATDCLRQRHSNTLNKIDCWFMDGFSPKRNSSMWSDDLAQLMYLHSAVDCTVSTFSAAGNVRRTLSTAGFEVSKKTGFGEKREMLVAAKSGISTDHCNRPIPSDPRQLKPWFQLPTRTIKNRTAIVIGAGFAGCSTANSLARRGWQVTLIDRANNIASGASGNLQAVLQCRLAADLTPRSRFYLQSFLYTHRLLNQLQTQQELNWQNCGILMLMNQAQSRLNKLQDELDQFYHKQVVSHLSLSDASGLANIGLSHEALWLPHGGWLDPKLLCTAYLNVNTLLPIKVVTSTDINQLEQTAEGWQVLSDKTTVAAAEVVILANSFDAADYDQTAFLPLIPVRGQITHIKETKLTEPLSSIVISDAYICPTIKNTHCVGATYGTGETDCNSNNIDDEQNLLNINSAFESIDSRTLTVTGSRAAVRCNTTDYFPVVGAVPDYQNFQLQYASLARNAKAKTEEKGSYLPGLYVNTGHGSYGLATCPLSAEYLASLIENESLPLPVDMMDSLSPARFIIRDLKKQRIGNNKN